MGGPEHISWLQKLEQEMAEWTMQGLWIYESRSALFRWNGHTGELLGLQESENPVSLERFLECVAPEHRAAVNQAIRSSDDGRQSRAISFSPASPSSSDPHSSSSRFLEAIWKAAPDPEPPDILIYGILRPYAHGERPGPLEELQKSVLHDVGSFFTTDSTLTETLKTVLAYLDEFGRFSASELWLSQPDGHRLVAYHARDAAGHQFYELSGYEHLFAPGTGLPGHVGRKDEPVIWKHLGEHPNFLRREAALEAGIRCGAGIPLNAAGLTGSLILLDQKQRQPAFGELQVYKALREFLAREILRKQKEEEMSFLFEGGPDLMAVVGTEGRFIKVNPAFCRTLGYSADEITSRPFTDFLHPEDAKGTLKEYKETITGDRRAHGFINRYRTSDGNYRWISWSSSGVFGLDGHVFAYGRDISQRMDYMRTLENQNKRLREIAWIQSHVVRAPLARLMGLIELLKSGQNSEQDRSWILQSIAESGQELDSIIGDIVNKSQKVEDNESSGNR